MADVKHRLFRRISFLAIVATLLATVAFELEFVLVEDPNTEMLLSWVGYDSAIVIQPTMYFMGVALQIIGLGLCYFGFSFGRYIVILTIILELSVIPFVGIYIATPLIGFMFSVKATLVDVVAVMSFFPHVASWMLSKQRPAK